MTWYTPAGAAALAGPDWLRTARQQAAERFAARSLPSTEEEIWRYSRIAELDLDRYASSSATTTVQGWTASTAPEPGDLGAAMTEPTDAFAELNTAFVEPVVIRVPAGTRASEPIVVEHVLAAGAAFPRLVVLAGAGAEVAVVERFTSAEDTEGLVAPVVEIVAGPSARVRYLSINELGRRCWHIGSTVARGEEGSETVLAAVALGGDYARQRIDARLVGRNASTEQVAVYFGEGDQMHDFRTLQDHDAPKTSSNLLFKGAVEGRAKSVYTGLIKVRPHAKGTTAFQTNRNLKLSTEAWAESVPNLEIETNDVRCSHASAVGPIDDEQRFYLESRGVPPAVAERLIVLGFFDEVLSHLPVASVAGPVREAVAAKLDRRDR